ncbi:cell division protein, partial [Achromatium sp. WMS2]
FLAYLELKRAVIENKAVGATAVILDAQTSEILAMVNQPSFNPNDRAKLTPAAMRNRAIIDLFEPGSTLKPLAVAASVDIGKCNADTPIDTRPGYMRIGRYTVRDIHSYGMLTVTSVLTKSSNVGVTKIALALTPEYNWQMYSKFGIGKRTELNFPGEVSGFLPHYSGWSSFEQATHSFGYGLNMTSLQLASAYAILAADGMHYPVSLIKLSQPPTGTRVIKASTAISLRRMLETVISDKGTAKLAAVEGYKVAGKTGTVKKAVAGGYAQNRHLAVFAGMIPADHPRLVMAIMVDEPRAKYYYGGLVAAPIFSSVMTGAMRILNVPPDHIPN